MGPALSNVVCTYETGYWAQPFPMQFEHMGSIGPHNSPSKSCFSAPREKRRILISSSDLPYDLVSLGQIVTIRVCLLVTHPWLFSAQGVPSFNFGNSFVSHVQRLDENPMAVELSGNLGGRIPAPNFCTIINSLSNKFLFTLNDCAILEPDISFLSLTPLCVYKYQNPVRGPFHTPVSLPELSLTLITFIAKFPL